MKILLYRSHNDITVLYESFVVKRKLLKEAVRKNIEEFYAKDRVKSNKVSISLKKNLCKTKLVFNHLYAWKMAHYQLLKHLPFGIVETDVFYFTL